MSNNTIPTDKIICVHLGNSTCKIILPVSVNKNLSIAHLQDEQFQSQVAENFAYDLGWIRGLFKEQKLKIVEVEILFPFTGLYLQLEKYLSKGLGEKCKVRVLHGAVVNVPKNDIVEHLEYVKKQVAEFNANNLQSN